MTTKNCRISSFPVKTEFYRFFSKKNNNKKQKTKLKKKKKKQNEKQKQILLYFLNEILSSKLVYLKLFDRKPLKLKGNFLKHSYMFDRFFSLEYLKV